jgi:uncharacterized 2Fe-2S/4Fe-4S cluster protein (DUF4445 family)
VVQASTVNEQSIQVRFVPDGRAWSGPSPVDLYVAAAGAGLLLDQPCGSQGTCGRCRVRVIDGAPQPTDADRDHCTTAELAAGWRLGCSLVLREPATVEIPVVARSAAGKSFGADLQPFDRTRPLVLTGLVPLPITRPGEDAAGSVLDGVARAAGLVERSLTASASALRELADAEGRGRAGGSEGAPTTVTVALHGSELVAARLGPSREMYGLALDIGTTSLAAALVALSDGRVAASASTLNPQAAYGADVISRIKHATDVVEGVRHLAGAVRRGLSDLAASLIADAGCDPEDIVIAAVAGNPTMMHAWLGVSPASLGRAPYLGLWTNAVTIKARDVGLPVHPNANVLGFPLVRSHVGGDAVAAAIVGGLDHTAGSRLLIDLGTNTEVLLAHGGRVFATSAAAGPAFEGATIRSGMRGAPGAIEAVSISDDGHVSAATMAGVQPKGLCGSGLIDAVAALLRAGIVSPTGYLVKPGDRAMPAALAARLVDVEGQRAFELVPRDAAAPAILVTARDVREVQLAKGSILAAITLMCRHAGVEPDRLDEVLVAGAFGNYVRKASALRIGLLPPIDPERVRLIGNASGVGARLALVDRDVLVRARELAARTEYLDLAVHPGYQDVFMTALGFPES